MVHVKRNSAFEQKQNAQIQIILRMCKVADAQTYLVLQCPHMPENTFSYGAARNLWVLFRTSF